MTTNAQAALQAAATIYGMTEGDASVQTVQGMAAQFKRWLDAKDAEDQPQAPKPVEEARRTPANASPPEYLWEIDMTPRNVSGPSITVEVWAADETQVISKALSARPGHSWGRPRRRIHPKPGPPRTEQQWLGNIPG
jgi:hypothetical protein